MELPFTVEQFFDAFREYNVAVWPAQAVLVGLALAGVVFVFISRRWADRTVCTILALLWAWMSIAYHLLFFARINPAAYLFAALALGAAACFFWYGTVRGRLRFSRQGGSLAAVGGVLIIFSLAVYPAWSWHAGHVFPAMPTFGLPCPTTIFTLGVMCFLKPPYPRAVLVAPMLWTLVGSQAALLLGVSQDLGLVLAAGAGVLIWMRARPRLRGGLA